MPSCVLVPKTEARPHSGASVSQWFGLGSRDLSLLVTRVMSLYSQRPHQRRAAFADCKFAKTALNHFRLFGGPYDNNRYLGTLFQLDKVARCGYSARRHFEAEAFTVPKQSTGVMVSVACMLGQAGLFWESFTTFAPQLAGLQHSGCET